MLQEIAKTIYCHAVVGSLRSTGRMKQVYKKSEDKLCASSYES